MPAEAKAASHYLTLSYLHVLSTVSFELHTCLDSKQSLPCQIATLMPAAMTIRLLTCSPDNDT